MVKETKIQRSDILFFDSKHYTGMTELKVFLHFLNAMNVQRPFRFSFVESQALMLPQLTLKQNIMLDSMPNSFHDKNTDLLENLITQKSNPFILEIYKSLSCLDCKPNEVDQEHLKLAGLLKGLISEGDYLLLSQPEKYLSEEKLKMVIRAINLECHSQNKIAFISSPTGNTWLPHITKQVIKNDKAEFIVRTMLKIVTDQPAQTQGHFEIRSTHLNQKKVA
ncbi:MAG: hypothetical protein COW00_10165 [Bdellovibrio sp. CG12_big_fil_rev_8_21_14_0_65_39_13]|nr:MAG: hypothetical protein COW78_01150 [Bdellovibrio sp. CG22_combo_CG10-13_8_21_14_all_39_27]PIQ59475.1 MAG: hypothetical protein COW00_10165 [Bdellovibrio sp. CG12_big_fil_rev_8_21_14_0_65_39_13]PIR36605.1 MAG: hypothetical protein COV37_02895 [Bdellovibrio sp. CG11_big_fil_rev_8_21_14_0_20_39_38]PJB53927.1 MAG: hypothetical protein CO099_04385 [Bdellovibrio sp. CG_4_9_14_3_um_filter_39_7]